MSELEKSAGLMGSAICASVFGAIGQMELCYSFAGMFTLLIAGKPIIMKLLK